LLPPPVVRRRVLVVAIARPGTAPGHKATAAAVVAVASTDSPNAAGTEGGFRLVRLLPFFFFDFYYFLTFFSDTMWRCFR
jgi:hypothetical protein